MGYCAKKHDDRVEMTQMSLSHHHLKKHGAAVLDMGQKVYVWYGEYCSEVERSAADALALHFQSEYGVSPSGPNICALTHEIDDCFWEVLRGEHKDSDSSSSSDEDKDKERHK